MDSHPVKVERAVAFLLHGKKLDPSEEEHLVRCDECRCMMVEAATAELNDSDQKSNL